MRKYQDWIYVFLLIAVLALSSKVFAQYEDIIQLHRQNAVIQLKFDLLKTVCQDFRENLENPQQEDQPL